jgi:hypothetical protein
MPKRCDRCNGANAECNTDLLDVVAVGTGLGSTRGCSGKQLLMGQKSSERECVWKRKRRSPQGRSGAYEWKKAEGREWGIFTEYASIFTLDALPDR